MSLSVFMGVCHGCTVTPLHPCFPKYSLTSLPDRLSQIDPSGRRIVHGLYLFCWNNGKPKCPSFWLQARLVIVPKTTPPSLNLNKTRGINLGTLEAKLMGAFNTYWLERWLAIHDVENQSGFRAKRGREDALFVMRQLIATRHEYGCFYGCFLVIEAHGGRCFRVQSRQLCVSH